jgi:hypothetical protein
MALFSKANSYWFCKSIFYTPTITIESLSDSCSFDTKQSRPLTEVKLFTFEFYYSIIRSVISLLKSARPPTIRRFIIPIIVNSVQRMLKTGSVSYIFQKIYKRIAPSITYFYTSSAISIISFGRRIITSCFHIVPSCKFLRPSIYSMPMFIHSVFLPRWHSNFIITEGGYFGIRQ